MLNPFSHVDELKHLSVAIKSGHDLLWIATVKRGQAIRVEIDEDIRAEKEACGFLTLCGDEWNHKVSSHASGVTLCQGARGWLWLKVE